ncbi:MAG: hypothetical protein Q8Q09_23640 [Deltaproteobacteria bacterium]|nr:hypothetical protein [Deltaproteobacteria bacterium]
MNDSSDSLWDRFRGVVSTVPSVLASRFVSDHRPANVQIREAMGPLGVRVFCGWSSALYRDDSYYVQPLTSELVKRLSVETDPFWKTAERALFLAYRDGNLVGRVAAVLDHERQRVKSDRTGQFGWFECINDPAVAGALFDAARAWLRVHGCDAIEGPYNPSATDEHGILVEGFETRPAVMEGHHRPYYESLVESAGLTRLREAYAWLVKAPKDKADLASIFPDKLTRAATRARSKPGVRTRALDLTRWDDEVGQAFHLFNRAMSTVDEFVPMDESSFRALCASFRPIVDAELIKLLEIDGRMVGYAMVIPDINEALQLAHGSLDPVSAVRVYMKAKKLTRACFKVLVIDPDFRQRGLESMLIEDAARAMIDKGYLEADLSLTAEENVKINWILAGLGFTIYRRYRTYRGSL